LQEGNEFKITESKASTRHKDAETLSEVVASISHRAGVQDALVIHTSRLTPTVDVLSANADTKNQKVEPESRQNDSNTTQREGFENSSVDVVNTASEDDSDAGTLESSFKSLC
jgi:transaldolase